MEETGKYGHRKQPEDALDIFYRSMQDVLAARHGEGLMDDDLHDAMNSLLQLGAAAGKEESPPANGTESTENPFSDLLHRYEAVVLAGDRQAAVSMVLHAAEGGMTVPELYKFVIQPFQYSLGAGWHAGTLSVAREHQATAISSTVMSLLYPLVLQTSKTDRVFLGTCVSGELHEFGLRMVSDYMESCGWNTYMLGANTPTDDALGMIRDVGADVVGISCTMIFNLHKVIELIIGIRQLSDNIRILVGGYPFNLDPDLWRHVGADACAASFEETPALADRLLNRQRFE